MAAARGIVAASVHVVNTHSPYLSLRIGSGRTFKTDVLRDMKSAMLPRHGILGITASRRAHLMEGGDAVAGLEFIDVGADFFHDPGDVVALVGGARDVEKVGEFPVFGVASGDDDADEELVFVDFGDGGVDNLDVRPWGLLVRESEKIRRS